MVPGLIMFGKEGIVMALTIGQEKCVNTLDEPLAVSAGAGSGKTFTLTRRIVHALESGYLSDPPSTACARASSARMRLSWGSTLRSRLPTRPW